MIFQIQYLCFHDLKTKQARLCLMLVTRIPCSMLVTCVCIMWNKYISHSESLPILFEETK